MSYYPPDLTDAQLCHVDGGHIWRDGGACVRCGARLRCGACGQFVTSESLDAHIDNACPVKWDDFEGGSPETRETEE